MPLFLADTNILIFLERRGQVHRRIESKYHLSLPSPKPLISIVTLAEVRAFADLRSWGEDRISRLEDSLDSFTMVPIIAGLIVDAYVEIDAYSHRIGHDMGKNDLWIAATAMVTGATLLTTDQDFDHLNGIYLIREWIDPTV